MKKILNTNGYYYTKESDKVKTLIGGSAQYEISGMNLNVGYDTFAGAKIGLGFFF